MISIKAAVARTKNGPFSIEQLSLDEPRPDEVLIRTVASGVCHTDLLVRDQQMPPGPPAVLGHEASGIVESVGSAVTTVAAGDAVVVTPTTCGQCRNCRNAHPMHCEMFMPLNFGGRRADGSTAYRDKSGAEVNGHFFGQSSFATRMLANERALVKVSDQVPLELLGPLCCGIQTGAGAVLNTLAPPAGSSLAVFGLGGVGLSAIMAANLTGCAPVIAVDLHRSRLDMALELGATHVIDATESNVVDQITGLTGGGADFALDAVGIPATARNAFSVLNIGGTAAVVGAGGVGQSVPIDLIQLLLGRTVKGSLEGDGVPHLFIPKLIEFHLAGRFPFDKLIQKYDSTEINQAVFDSESGHTIKPVIVY